MSNIKNETKIKCLLLYKKILNLHRKNLIEEMRVFGKLLLNKLILLCFFLFLLSYYILFFHFQVTFL